MVFVLGSRNSHKLEEMKGLLPGMHLISLPDDIPEAVEDADSFAGNACIKSETYAKATDQWVIADDSGICVDALDGAPGIHSARFAGVDADDAKNNLLLLEKLKNQNNRGAHYVCSLSLSSPEGEVFNVEGRCYGEILEAQEGDNGFGYDPLFFSRDLNLSFALAHPDDKARVSHRKVACDLFLREIKSREILK